MGVSLQARCTYVISADVVAEWLALEQEQDIPVPREVFVYSDNVDTLQAAIRHLSSRERSEDILFYPGTIGSLLASLPLSIDVLVCGGSETSPQGDFVAASAYFSSHARYLLLTSAPVDGRLASSFGQVRVLHAESTGRFISYSLQNVGSARRSLSPMVFRQTAGALRELVEHQVSNNFQEALSIATQIARRELLVSQQSLRGSRPVVWPYRPQTSEMPETLPDGTAWPRISVITPSYNCGKYLEETILSVLNQKYPSLEFILIDGGSTDETVGILDRYRRHFAHCVSEKDRGQSHAINKGLSLATGDVCTWLNADDMLAPGALYAMAFAFWQTGADVVAGVCQILRDGVIVEEHLTSAAPGTLDITDLADIDNRWLKGAYFYQPEVFFTRDVWARAGGYVSEALHYVMDYDLWCRFASAGANVAITAAPIAMFRIHPEQKTFTPDRYIGELKEVARQYAGEFSRPGLFQPGLDVLRICFVDFPVRETRSARSLAELLGRAGHAVHYLQPGLHGLEAGSHRGVLFPEDLASILGVEVPDIYILAGDGDSVLRQAAALGECRERLILLFDSCPTAQSDLIKDVVMRAEPPVAVAATQAALARILGLESGKIVIVGLESGSAVGHSFSQPFADRRNLGIPFDATVVYWPGKDLTSTSDFQWILSELSSAMGSSDVLVTDCPVSSFRTWFPFKTLDLASLSLEIPCQAFADVILLGPHGDVTVGDSFVDRDIPLLHPVSRHSTGDRNVQLTYDSRIEGSLAFSLARLLHSAPLRLSLRLYRRLEVNHRLSPAASIQPLHRLFVERIPEFRPNLTLKSSHPRASIHLLAPSTGFSFGRNVGNAIQSSLSPRHTAHRRLMGPSCQIRYRDVEPGNRTLFLSLECFLPFQSVRIILNQNVVSYCDVPISTEAMPEFALFIPVEIEQDNIIDLEFAQAEGVGPNKGACCNLTGIAFLRLG